MATSALGIPRESFRAPPLVWGAILAVGLFVSVLLHELSHALVAIRNGGKIRSILLMMLGGVTQLEGDVRPEREAWMAFAGPLASFGIAALSFLVYATIPMPPAVTVALVTFGSTNALLGAFNLLPAFPMDGGRVLRGLLTRRLGRERATRVATTVGRVLAVALGLLGLFTFNLMLTLIAVFVYLGAAGERRRCDTRDVLRDVTVVEFMSPNLDEARGEERVGDVAERLIRTNRPAAKVVDGDEAPEAHHHTLGIVTASELTQLTAEGRADEPVRGVMRSDLPTVHPEDHAPETLDALSGSGPACAVVVVDQSGEVVGLVTPAEMERAVVLGSVASRSTRRGAQRPGL
jgi:Zn-dependent protease/CBS domain-containing protein